MCVHPHTQNHNVVGLGKGDRKIFGACCFQTAPGSMRDLVSKEWNRVIKAGHLICSSSIHPSVPHIYTQIHSKPVSSITIPGFCNQLGLTSNLSFFMYVCMLAHKQHAFVLWLFKAAIHQITHSRNFNALDATVKRVARLIHKQTNHSQGVQRRCF